MTLPPHNPSDAVSPENDRGRRNAFDDTESPDGAKISTTTVGGADPQTATSDAGIGHPGYRAPAPENSRFAAKRSLLGRAIHETFGQTGARIGAVWILIMIVVAVFAPFIANSRPFIARWADGSATYPLFESLTWVDYTLVIAFFTTLALVLAKRFLAITPGVGMLILIGVLTVTMPVAAFFATPPVIETYERFRVAEAQGRLQRALYAPVPYSPNDALRDEDRVVPQQPPSARHLLGTTVYGEDMLSRMIFATRIALAIGFIATGISTMIGIVLGGIMGYAAGTTDLLLMRLIEIVEAIPRLIVLLLVTTFFGRNIWYMMITLGLIAWTSDARFIRAEFLKLRKQDFVQAGIASGLPLRNILFRHMLPNGIAPVLVNASFGVAGAILIESILSFLGLGLAPEDASWGQLLYQATQGGSGFNWWIATFPGLAIFLTVFAYILIGEAMRDAIDPQLKKAGE